MNLRKILVTTDFSERSEQAFAPAAALARRHSARLDVVHVAGVLPAFAMGHSAAVTLGAYRADLERQLGEVVARPVFESLDVQGTVLEGYGPEAVDRFQQDGGHDLLVTATHGHSGLRRLVMGSFAERLVQLSHCPVLTFRPGRAGDDFTPKRIVVPYDLSELARQVFPWARDIAGRHDAEIVVVHVLDVDLFPVSEFPVSIGSGVSYPVYWEDARKKARQQLEAEVSKHFGGVRARAEVRVGPPVSEIVAAAEAFDADAIILSTHGRTGLSHALLGSVAERVVRKAPCSVLTSRPLA